MMFRVLGAIFFLLYGAISLVQGGSVAEIVLALVALGAGFALVFGK